jgi:hypothetical protein
MAQCSPILVDLFIQRTQQIRMSSLLPKNRLEVVDPYLEINPSSGNLLTPFDLNMRRKAEILKYNKNVGDTSGNFRNTKAGKWAYTVRNRTPTITTQLSCPAKIVGPLPVGRSNVPPGGDTDFLVYDNSVPLYNFTNPINNRTYDANNTIIMPTQQVILESDTAVQIPNQSFRRVATFMYTNLVSQPLCTIDVRIPLCLEIVATNVQFPLSPTTYPITVLPVVNLCYNDRVVVSQSTPTISYSWSTINLISQSSNTSFTIKKYIGYVTVTGIVSDSPIPMSVFTIRVTTQVNHTINGLSYQLIANPPSNFIDDDPQNQLTVNPIGPYQPFDAQFEFS